MIGTTLRLMNDAKRVGMGQVIPQRQDSLDDQLADLATLANRFGLYDAADWLHDRLGDSE